MSLFTVGKWIIAKVYDMEMNFNEIIRHLDGCGYPNLPNKVYIRVPDAEELLRRGLEYFTEGNYVWDEKNYRPIVDWLKDNKGRGILLAGECGLGKTLIGMRILPLIINESCNRIVNCYKAHELNQKPDEVMRNHIIYIDDVGTETTSNIYGNRRMPFSELVDMAENKGKLLMASTNLDVTHIEEKYGIRTIDRLRGIVKYVPFTGKSYRK